MSGLFKAAGATVIVIPNGLVPRGAYNAGTDYAVGDSVSYYGSSYVMYVDAAAGTLPTDTTKWQVLATRADRRVNTVASSATPTVNTDITDVFTITALATAITSMTANLSGTPRPCQSLIYRILDNGVAHGITWGASFASRGATLPITTLAGKYLTVGLMWNEVASVWDCSAVAQET